MRAGDRDETVLGDEGGEGLRAVQDRQAAALRLEELGLSGQRALVTTMVSASPTFAASWPMCTSAPRSRMVPVVAVSRESLPVTRWPAARNSRRDAAHAGAADADEVHRAEVVRDRLRQVGLDGHGSSVVLRWCRRVGGRPPGAAARRRGRGPSSGRRRRGVRRCRPGPSCRDPGPSCRMSRSWNVTQSSSNSASATSRAPPASTTSFALWRCSPLPTGYGTGRSAARRR